VQKLRLFGNLAFEMMYELEEVVGRRAGRLRLGPDRSCSEHQEVLL
jgi:hypothetical protein